MQSVHQTIILNIYVIIYNLHYSQFIPIIVAKILYLFQNIAKNIKKWDYSYKHDGEIPMPSLFLMENGSTGQIMLSGFAVYIRDTPVPYR